MFSKSRINEPAQKPAESTIPSGVVSPATEGDFRKVGSRTASPSSVLAPDLKIVGNITTAGDILIEGEVDGDIRAHLLTVGEGSVVRGELLADDIIVHGSIFGRVRGLKVRLTSTARVQGDIVHNVIAIEPGAQFDGSVQRQDDPLGVETRRDSGLLALSDLIRGKDSVGTI